MTAAQRGQGEPRRATDGAVDAPEPGGTRREARAPQTGWTTGDPARLAHAAELVDAELDLSVDARVLADALALLRRTAIDIEVDVADLDEDLMANVERSLELAAWVLSVGRVLRHGADLGDGRRALPDPAIAELVGPPVVTPRRPPAPSAP